jgi:hypothetical protein
MIKTMVEKILKDMILVESFDVDVYYSGAKNRRVISINFD